MFKGASVHAYPGWHSHPLKSGRLTVLTAHSEHAVDPSCANSPGWHCTHPAAVAKVPAGHSAHAVFGASTS